MINFTECAIICFANSSYSKGAARLRETAEQHEFKGELFIFTDESQVPCPTHLENPYSFKTFIFERVKNLGYKKILWVDSSVYLIKNIDHIFELIDKDGYLMQEAGHYVGTWANDKCLNYFRIERDQAMNMLMYGNAGLLGLNFENEIAIEFFNKWHQASKDGIFIGKWNNNDKTESEDERCKGHRHDMTCGSIIANQLKMKYHSGQNILMYGAPEDEALNDTIVFKAQGIN